MIVLDTHVWLWWINRHLELIGLGWNDLILQVPRLGVSAISCFVVAWLERHGRIELPCLRAIWYAKALTGSGVDLLSITPEIASLAVDLPEHHRAPQDRIIIATALVHDARLISADGMFPLYQELAGKLIP